MGGDLNVALYEVRSRDCITSRVHAGQGPSEHGLGPGWRPVVRLVMRFLRRQSQVESRGKHKVCAKGERVKHGCSESTR